MCRTHNSGVSLFRLDFKGSRQNNLDVDLDLDLDLDLYLLYGMEWIVLYSRPPLRTQSGKSDNAYLL